MVFFDYRKIRIGTLIFVGFMPMFFMTLAMGGFRFNWIGGALAGFASLLVFLVIGNALLTKNSWIKAIEREGILILGLNSTGIIPTAIARIKHNKFGQKLFVFNQGNEEVSRLYDREAAWTFKEPLNGTYEVLRNKETGLKTVRIELEEDSFAKSVFFTDYMQCLIFNEQSGNFMTKQELGDEEREKLISMITLNEQRELRELNVTLNNFMRDYANRLHQVSGGIVNSTLFKVIFIVLAIAVVAFLAWNFVPGLQEIITGVPEGVAGTINTGLPDVPINR